MAEETSATAAGQWGIPDAGNGQKPPPPPSGTMGNGATNGAPPGPEIKPPVEPAEKFDTDIYRRRGFGEAISSIECPMHRLGALLDAFRQEAADRMAELDEQANTRIIHLREQIAVSREKISDLKHRIKTAEQTREADDPDLSALIGEKKDLEKQLSMLQIALVNVRKKLGEAKAGIIDKSLDEAVVHVNKALALQDTIYTGTNKLNRQKYLDEQDYLARLKKYYEELYDYYNTRYQEVNKHLAVLNADGINPVTTHVLATVGSVSFAAAGFFFSTFAGSAGFGNQDMLYFVFSGLIDTFHQPASMLVKLGVLLGLIVLVTLVSLACYYLLKWLKTKSREEILSELMIEGEVGKKWKNPELHARIKSNNWYALWLQFVPGIFIAGLILLAISRKASSRDINAINSSSEGLIIGTSIAMALAGIIYLYIIKVVEPRLLKKYIAGQNTPVNWIKANGELVAIIITFLVFCICIIAIPYSGTEDGHEIIAVEPRTRYAMLLFMAISLAGGISFAYSVRSHALISISHYLEVILGKLSHAIAYCSGPETPDTHNKIAGREGNILQRVLRQFAFKTSIDDTPPEEKGKPKDQNPWTWLIELLKKTTKTQSAPKEPLQTITVTEAWEEHRLSHITDELKAAEFEYREMKQKVQKASDDIADYRTARKAEIGKYQADQEACEKNIREHEEKMVKVLEDKSVRKEEIRNKYHTMISGFQDGFHLGMWYRENDMGPRPGFFNNCSPIQPTGTPAKPLLLTNNNK